MLKIPEEPAETVFEQYESNVRSYCRNFPAVLSKALGSYVYDTSGRKYLDLLAGAGALNYGHSDPTIMAAVQDYLANNGIVHSLDLYTEAKHDFIVEFQKTVLAQRGLSYKLQFPGPTGTNAVEAALKLARKVTARNNVVAFTHAFHGMTLGALGATSNQTKRRGAGIALPGVTFMPYDGFAPDGIDGMRIVEEMVGNPDSGVEPPAAFLVEIVQGEGGLNVASTAWLKRLAALAKEVGALLIVDDIQAGIGRTGRFFSFEEAQVTPDIVLLSKSLSGFGSPLSLVLLSPDIDAWHPGEHNGTFRGNNLAFVGATAALRTYWRTETFQNDIASKSAMIRTRLKDIANRLQKGKAHVKGKGLFIGLCFSEPQMASDVSKRMFEHNVIVETCGPSGKVLKLLPPLTISPAELDEGLAQLENALLIDQKMSAA